MDIPNKADLKLPFTWEEMRTTDSSKFTKVFLKKPVCQVMNDIKLLGRFSRLSRTEKIATLCDAYTECLKINDHEQAADLAGGIFLFLNSDVSIKTNIESAETFYENVITKGYKSMWFRMTKAAYELSSGGNNTGTTILNRVRKRRDKNLNGNFELMLMEQEIRENEIKRYTPVELFLAIYHNNIVQIILGAAGSVGIIMLFKYLGIIKW